ncbi:uncharacterized protein [Patagioenas fasciata]|uniref:uncharacterized protein n=1 Tax=Patagioenas fasciata TaxID=372321 RepID=UPI003A9A0361
MAALAVSQVPGGAAAAAIRRPSPPLRYTLMSGLSQRPGPGSRKAAGKMAAVSAPYAKYPPPPPLRPPGGKGKRVGFTPPPPPAQTPSSLSVSASRARQRRSRRPCDPLDSRRLSPDRLRPQATRTPARRPRTGPAPRSGAVSPGAQAGRQRGRLPLTNNAGASEPLSPPPGVTLPAAARGVPSRAPAPPPRARSPAPATETQPGRVHFKKGTFLPQELAPRVP